MAKSLATYMKDPRAIQQSVRERFGDCPSLHTIKDFMLAHDRAKARLGKDGWNKGGDISTGQQAADESMIRIGSDLLRTRLCAVHPEIMRRLETAGNMVVWP